MNRTRAMFGVNRAEKERFLSEGVSNFQFVHTTSTYNKSRDIEYMRIYCSLYGDC